MVNFYLVPSWFFGFGTILELIFGIITLAVSLYSFKVYKYSQLREPKIFGWSFLALSLSYFIWAAVSGYAGFLAQKSVDNVFNIAGFTPIIVLGIYAHIIFFVLGLVTLAYLTFGIRSQRVYTLLASLSLISVLFSQTKSISFYFVSSLLLLYVLSFYAINKWKNKSFSNYFVLLSFVFLFAGTVDFTFSAVRHITYVVGHIFYLIGYAFILANFILLFMKLRKR